MLGKVLITDDVHPTLIEGFERMGFECHYEPNTTDAAVRTVIADYEGLIINSKINVDRALIDAAPNLRFVGRLGSGMEVVDRAYAAEKGVAVLSSPEGNRNAVAEQALGMLIALANNLTKCDVEVKQFEWHRERNRGWELRGKTISIVGFGHTGSSFATKLLGMGMRVLIHDKYLPTDFLAQWGSGMTITRTEKGHLKLEMPSVFAYPRYDTEGWWSSRVESRESIALGQVYDAMNYEWSTYEEADWQTVLDESDIVSFHLPLTEETKHLAGKEFFEGCRKSVTILNTSRGKVVNTGQLIDALKSGKVAGACLDVFENEKTATYTEGERAMYSTLLAMENVVVSPHIAGWTVESKRRLAEILLSKVGRVMGS